LGIGDFIRESRRILKLATKPARKELWLSIRITILGMILVGMVSYIIQIVMTVVTAGWGVE
jgi:protein translocase SEC61 complex gamma subunit